MYILSQTKLFHIFIYLPLYSVRQAVGNDKSIYHKLIWSISSYLTLQLSTLQIWSFVYHLKFSHIVASTNIDRETKQGKF